MGRFLSSGGGLPAGKAGFPAPAPLLRAQLPVPSAESKIGCPILAQDLIAFWPLDEPGGQRRDMLGYNPLTDNNTVTSANGIGGQGTSANFTSANSEYLSVASNPQLVTGDVDFSVACWSYFDSLPGTTMTMCHKFAGAGQREWTLQWIGANNRITFTIRNAADTAFVEVRANSLGAPTTGRWYYVVTWHDSTNDLIAIQIGSSASYDLTSTSGGVDTSTTDFQIGSDQGTNFFDGRIALVGFWKRVLSQQERTDLYNFGRGNTIISY